MPSVCKKFPAPVNADLPPHSTRAAGAPAMATSPTARAITHTHAPARMTNWCVTATAPQANCCPLATCATSLCAKTRKARMLAAVPKPTLQCCSAAVNQPGLRGQRGGASRRGAAAADAVGGRRRVSAAHRRLCHFRPRGPASCQTERGASRTRAATSPSHGCTAPPPSVKRQTRLVDGFVTVMHDQHAFDNICNNAAFRWVHTDGGAAYGAYNHCSRRSMLSGKCARIGMGLPLQQGCVSRCVGISGRHRSVQSYTRRQPRRRQVTGVMHRQHA